MLIPFRYQGGAFEIVNTPAPLTSARQKRTRLFFSVRRPDPFDLSQPCILLE